jgi:hypothetical protein
VIPIRIEIGSSKKAGGFAASTQVVRSTHSRRRAQHAFA